MSRWLRIRTGAVVMAVIGGAAAMAEDAPREVPIWTAGHAANPGGEMTVAGTKAWAERLNDIASLTPFPAPAEKRTGAACIICPGGGYGGLSMDKEGLEPARWLAERGISAFVLRYRCGGGKHQHPVPMHDVQRAIRLVRSRAGEWGIEPDKIGVLGFSAGGHLASTAATHFDDGDSAAADPVDRQGCRPAFQVLVYPVITMIPELTHGGSRENLLGKTPSEELADLMSNDKQVTDRTPPGWLIHATDDGGVPVLNSLLYYSALVDHKIPAEMHLYEIGGHGFGMLRGDRPADKWPELLEPWLRAHGWSK